MVFYAMSNLEQIDRDLHKRIFDDVICKTPVDIKSGFYRSESRP